MQRISVFDMLKIGVGPSSSHTMGPWLAAQRFLDELSPAIRSCRVSSQSGPLRIPGEDRQGTRHRCRSATWVVRGRRRKPSTPRPSTNESGTSPRTERIRLSGSREIPFDPETDIVFINDQQLPFHPNAMRFTAWLDDGTQHDAVFYSIGGGFIVKEA